jgi:hypothetical protein
MPPPGAARAAAPGRAGRALRGGGAGDRPAPARAPGARCRGPPSRALGRSARRAPPADPRARTRCRSARASGRAGARRHASGRAPARRAAPGPRCPPAGRRSRTPGLGSWARVLARRTCRRYAGQARSNGSGACMSRRSSMRQTAIARARSRSSAWRGRSGRRNSGSGVVPEQIEWSRNGCTGLRQWPGRAEAIAAAAQMQTSRGGGDRRARVAGRAGCSLQ